MTDLSVKQQKLLLKEEKERDKLINIAKQNIKPDKPKEAETVYEHDPSKVQSVNQSVNLDEKEDTFEETVNKENPEKQIIDFSLSLETRVEALNLFYEKYGEGDTIEAINRISMMYDMSNTSILREYLLNICKISKLSSFLKSLVAISVANKKYEDGEDLLFLVYKNLDSSIATPYKLDILKLMTRTKKYRPECLTFFLQFVNDFLINEDFRYKSILSIENIENEEKSEYFFLKEGLLSFLRNEKNKISLRILAAQNLFSKNLETKIVEDILIFILQNNQLEYNTKADTADILLKYGSEEGKNFAKDIIRNLGVGDKKIVTLYGNAQNVHTEEIEQSVLNILEKLYCSEFKCVDDLEKINSSIREIAPKDKLENISLSLSRINMDRALYSKYYCTLSQTLVKVWNYIQNNKDKEELLKRLIEELYDMCGICSSGFLSRLVNCISGFGEFSLKISWKDQIVSNLTGRLNAQIRKMDNIRLSELILEEMTLESSDFEKRKHFLKFFRKVMPDIRNEMEEEFIKHISPEEFDLYFRAGIMMYETGSSI